MTTRDLARSTRAALYARVSTSDRGQDPQLQVEELRQVAEHRGWLIFREYVDEGVSGAARSRPALDAMLEDAQAGRFDVLVVWKLDRLGRSLQHLLGTLDQLTEWGIAFASVRDPGIDTTTPTGRLITQMLGAVAEFERALIRERVIAGVRRAQESGKHCGRPSVGLDLRPALAMLRQGWGLKSTARACQVKRTTLRRRLLEAGEWPVRPPDPENKGSTIHDDRAIVPGVEPTKEEDVQKVGPKSGVQDRHATGDQPLEGPRVQKSSENRARKRGQ